MKKLFALLMAAILLILAAFSCCALNKSVAYYAMNPKDIDAFKNAYPPSKFINQIALSMKDIQNNKSAYILSPPIPPDIMEYAQSQLYEYSFSEFAKHELYPYSGAAFVGTPFKWLKNESEIYCSFYCFPVITTGEIKVLYSVYWDKSDGKLHV